MEPVDRSANNPAVFKTTHSLLAVGSVQHVMSMKTEFRMRDRITCLTRLALLWIGLSATGCGLMETLDGVIITLPTQEYHFYLDVTQARKQLEQRIREETDLDVDLSGETIPQQLCNQDQCVEIPTIKEVFEIEIPAQRIDLSQSEQLLYIDLDQIKSVAVETFLLDIQTNSLNFDLPSIEIYMDDLTKENISSQHSHKIAELPPVPAHVVGEERVLFTPQGQRILSNYLLSLQFAIGAVANFSIDTEKNDSIPDGILEGNVKIGMNFTIGLI